MRGRGGWARTLETDERPPLSKQWIRKESEKYLKISHRDNVGFKRPRQWEMENKQGSDLNQTSIKEVTGITISIVKDRN